MNILDENVPESQRLLLRSKRVPVRQIGHDVGRRGLKDKEIVVLLHRMNRPTFFTLDSDFYDPALRHLGHCLVHLDVEEDTVAEYVLRVLRHRALNSKVKRMGRIIKASPMELRVWRIREEQDDKMPWVLSNGR